MFGKLRYADIKNCDLVNGEGARVSLFVTGCVHGCKGCFNADLMNPNSGTPFTVETWRFVAQMLACEHISGLSLLGGDPLHPRNLQGVKQIVSLVKEHFPTKDIWLWTGYTLADLTHEQREIVESVDMLIDGRYDETKKTRKPFRGSDNQVQYMIVDRIPVKII